MIGACECNKVKEYEKNAVLEFFLHLVKCVRCTLYVYVGVCSLVTVVCGNSITFDT